MPKLNNIAHSEGTPEWANHFYSSYSESIKAIVIQVYRLLVGTFYN